MTHPCSGCGLRSCDGQCFHESPEPSDEETLSTLTLEQCREIWGGLTVVEHLGPGRIAA